MKQSDFQIQIINDYSVFKGIAGNRNIKDSKYESHIKRLMDSIKELGQLEPVIVNKNFYVFDGQNRIEALKRLKLPVVVVVNNNGTLGSKNMLKNVQVINTNRKNWSNAEYLESYCKLGNNEYITLRTLKNEYGLSIPVLIHVCLGATIHGEAVRVGMIAFKEGKFKIKNIDYVFSILDRMRDFDDIFIGYRYTRFVNAFMQISKHPKYNHHIMISQANKYLLKARRELMGCNTKRDYIEALTIIYNYNRSLKRVLFNEN